MRSARGVYADVCTNFRVFFLCFHVFLCFLLCLTYICPSHDPHATYMPRIYPWHAAHTRVPYHDGRVQGLCLEYGAGAGRVMGVHGGMHEFSLFFLCFPVFFCVLPTYALSHAHHTQRILITCPSIHLTHALPISRWVW